MRLHDQWNEAGITFRSNLLTEIGDQIELHAHSFDHVALVHGRLAVKEITPDGEEKRYELASREFGLGVGYKVSIPAMHQHAFTVLELPKSGPAEVLCMFPVGA